MDGYVFRLYSNDIPRQFHFGDRVFVWLKSNRSTGLATIVQTPDDVPRDSPFAGRYLARFGVHSNLTAHVRPERLYPVYTEHQQILVCYNTDDYRRLARSQVNCSDSVLELGSSYGICTNILAEHAGHVTGIDNSEEAVAEARQRYPRLHSEVADVLQQPAAVLDLIRNRFQCGRCSSKKDTHSSSSNSSSGEDKLCDTSSSGNDKPHSTTNSSSSSSSGKDTLHSPSNSSSRDNPHSNQKDNGCCSGSGRNADTVHCSSSIDFNSTPPTQLNSTSSPGQTPSTAPQPHCCCYCNTSSVGPCSVVFVDIGGDRQLKALLTLIPWVMEHIQPRLLVVKSEELAVAAGKELARQQQQALQREQQTVIEQKPAELQQSGQQQQQQQGQQVQWLQQQRLQQQRLQQQYGQQAVIAREPTKLQQLQEGLGQQVPRQQQQCGWRELQQEEPADTARYAVQPQQPGQHLGHTLDQEQHLEQQEQHQQRQIRQQLRTSADQQLHQQLAVLQCSSSGGSSSKVSDKPVSPISKQLSASADDKFKAPTYGVIQNPKAWWDQLEMQQGLNPLLHSGEPEQWFLKARAQGFVKNPLRYPQRFTAEGVRICRPHNYDRCYKVVTCEFDHVSCHHCGVAGHRAVDCPVT